MRDSFEVIQHEGTTTVYISTVTVIWQGAARRLLILRRHGRCRPLTVACNFSLERSLRLNLTTKTPNRHTRSIHYAPSMTTAAPPLLIRRPLPSHRCTLLPSHPRSNATLGRRHTVGRLVRPVCSISSPAISRLPPVAPLTGQNPRTARIGLWHALWGVTSALFSFFCLFACLSYLSAGTRYDRSWSEGRSTSTLVCTKSLWVRSCRCGHHPAPHWKPFNNRSFFLATTAIEIALLLGYGRSQCTFS